MTSTLSLAFDVEAQGQLFKRALTFINETIAMDKTLGVTVVELPSPPYIRKDQSQLALMERLLDELEQKPQASSPGGFCATPDMQHKYALRLKLLDLTMNQVNNVIYKFTEAAPLRPDSFLSRPDLCAGISLYELCSANHRSAHTIESVSAKILTTESLSKILKDYSMPDVPGTPGGAPIGAPQADLEQLLVLKQQEMNMLTLGARNCSISILRYSRDTVIRFFLAIRSYSTRAVEELRKSFASFKTYRDLCQSLQYKNAVDAGATERNRLAVALGRQLYNGVSAEFRKGFVAELSTTHSAFAGMQELTPVISQNYNVFVENNYGGINFYNGCFRIKSETSVGVMFLRGREYGMTVFQKRVHNPAVGTPGDMLNLSYKDHYGNATRYEDAFPLGVPQKVPHKVAYYDAMIGISLEQAMDMDAANAASEEFKADINWKAPFKYHPKGGSAHVYDIKWTSTHTKDIAALLDKNENDVVAHNLVAVATYISSPDERELDLRSLLALHRQTDNLVAVPITNAAILSGDVLAIWASYVQTHPRASLGGLIAKTDAKYVYFNADELEMIVQFASDPDQYRPQYLHRVEL